MKVLIPFLLLLVPISLNAQTDSDWENLTAEYCKGVNKFSKGISVETKAAIIFSGETGTPLVEIFTDLISQDPEQFTKDVVEIQKMETDMHKFNSKLTKKYDYIYGVTEQDDLNMHFITVLDTQAGCEFAKALIEVTMQHTVETTEPIE
jgi:hypothetical protein